MDRYMPPEVIVTPYSMSCSASLPILLGAKPIFADIEKDYYCLDVKSIANKITPRTVGILVVDLFGMPYDADAINALAKRHNLWVVEDAAQAIGAKYKGKYAGTLADIGVYSLNVHKHIQCGEGGMMVTDNDRTAMKLRLIMNHAEAVNDDLQRSEVCGDVRPDYGNLAGMNLRMTEMQAAIAREQLKKLPEIFDKYQEMAKDFNIPLRPGCTSAYYKFASMNMPKNPNKELYNMKNSYVTPIYKIPLFRFLGYEQNLCPVCEEVDKKIKVAWVKEPI
jgi:dTDP-4-amino-4,6-dideoxygalactose transaminase